jgi:uncharacterized membrane protein
MTCTASDATPRVAAGDALPWLTLLARGLGLLAMVGAAAGIGIGARDLWDHVPTYLTHNQISGRARLSLLAYMAIGAFLVMASTVTAVWARSRYEAPATRRIAGRIDEIGRRLAPIAVLALLPMLLDWKVWRDRDIDFLLLVLVFAFAANRCVRLAIDAPPVFRPGIGEFLTRVEEALSRSRIRTGPFATGIVLLASAGYAFFFSFFTIRYHRNLHTTSFDLGLEENILWNIIHGFKFFRSSPFSGSMGSHFGNHATFFSYLIAPLYALHQHAETLLVIQAVLMGAAAIPLFFFARRHLGSWIACLVALTYLLYPPLHGAALYDFHYLPLGPVFLWSALYCLEARRDRWAVLFVILTLSVREDVAVGLGVVGAYLVLTGQRPRAGILVGALGAATFVILKLVVMPRFAGHDSFVYMYNGLLPSGEATFGGVLKTVATNPGFIFGSLIEQNKLIYVLQLFVPLVFLPVLRPLGLLFVPIGFLFTLLSTGYAPLIQTSFQYTTHWTSYLFIGLVATLAWFRRADAEDRARGGPRGGRLVGAVVALACALVPATYQYGAILQQHTVRGGFGLYDFDTTKEELADRKHLKELLRRIPPRASVAGSENLVPQVSNRAEAYTLRTGNFSADYLLFTMPIRSDERSYVADPIGSGQYGVVAISGSFGLAKKGYSTALNPTLAGRL